MKNYLPYILGVVLLAAVIVLVATSSNKQQKVRLDERVTLRKEDKIPYGTFVAYQELGYLFPKAKIITNRAEPGYWEAINTYDEKQALLVIAPKFSADETEIKKLIEFVRQGNDVFISTQQLSYTASELFECQVVDRSIGESFRSENDSLVLSLENPPFEKRQFFGYPGKTGGGYFNNYDASLSEIIGEDERERPCFIRLRAGKGNFYLHLVPLAFSNYFLLHKGNMAYYNKALSVIDPDTKLVVWDEYFLNKRFTSDEPDKKKSWFSVLMNEENANGKKPFRAAFWLLIGIMILYVLQEMRRKQRIIPVITPPRNDSMDFVKTIGRLYFDKGDHLNLAKKMAAYFLEHVRNKYQLPTGTIDETFTRNLAFKSGVEEVELKPITGFINFIEKAPGITPGQLLNFQERLESFYKKSIVRQYCRTIKTQR